MRGNSVIISANRSNISPNKCSQKGAINGINAAISKIPTVNVIGKPITKIDSCGVIRLSMPSARFTVRSRVIIGKASIKPLRKIMPPARVSAKNALLLIGSPPIGNV